MGSKHLLSCFFILLWGNVFAGGHQAPQVSQLKFIENKGQWDESIHYQADLPGGELSLDDEGLTYLFYDQEKYAELLAHHHDHFFDTISAASDSLRMHRFRVNFLGGKAQKLIGEKAYSEHYNYFIGAKENWAGKVKAYHEVHFNEVYPDIDMHLYRNEGSLKYEFLVAPHASPDQIRLEYDGVDTMYLEEGNLVVHTVFHQLNELAPVAYQYVRGKRKEVNCSFALEGNVLTYDLGHYNKNYPLVIDPQLIFSTYSGSTADNWGNTACLDNEGNLYTGGTVFRYSSSGGGFLGQFPATNGAFQTSFQGGNTDIGILKFDSSGTQLLYATYIGGNDAEIPTSLVTNPDGELFILGTSGSTNYPVSVNAFEQNYQGGSPLVPVGGYTFYGGTDIIVSKLSVDGSELLASTYVGGSGNDGVLQHVQVGSNLFFSPLNNNYGDILRGDINVDEEGNVYVASVTTSTDFPVVNAYQPIYGGGSADGCTFKLNSDFSALEWSTYLGGSGADAFYSIQRDSLNGVYLAGGTESSDYPTTDSVLAMTGFGDIDAVVSHLSNGGDSLLQSTYLGTENFDQAYFVQLDKQENVYLLGQSKGEFPVTVGTYSNSRAGLFLTKLNYRLDSVYYSTTLGSVNPVGTTIVPNISPTAFLVNDCENIFIAGWGGETNASYNGGLTKNMPLTPDAYQKVSDGSDFYMMVLLRDATDLLYATYFGGPVSQEHVDGGTSRFDKRGIVYQSVCAGCGSNDDFPLYPNPTGPDTYPQFNNSDNCNNGVFKFDLASLRSKFSYKDTCLSYEVEFINESLGGVDFIWDFGDGNFANTATKVPVTHDFKKAGNYRVTLYATDMSTCTRQDTFSLSIKVREPFTPYVVYDTICLGDSIRLTAKTFKKGVSYSWEPLPEMEGETDSVVWVKPERSTVYFVTVKDTLGCSKQDQFAVVVRSLKKKPNLAVVGSCTAMPTVHFNTSGANGYAYHWKFGDGRESFDPTPKVVYEKEGTYQVIVERQDAYCYGVDTMQVSVEDLRLPNIFTPNGDDKNEEFYVKGLEGTGQWTLEIYNRWGKLVHENQSYQNDWHAEGLAEGTYYYLLIAPDETSCKGWVEVVR